MAPNYKLIYFPVRARGEIIRLVFAAAKKDYTFKPVTFEEWPSVKPSTPYGALPVLDIDGVQHGQGMAIAVYLAGEFNLMGRTNSDRFIIEQLLQLREDVAAVEIKHFLEGDAAKKAEFYRNLETDVYPKFLANIENILKKNNEGKGFVVGSQLSLGDLTLYGGVTTAIQNFPNLVAKYPVLSAHRKRIAAIDGIKQHLAQLTETPL